jgi:hypothetical protein
VYHFKKPCGYWETVINKASRGVEEWGGSPRNEVKYRKEKTEKDLEHS